MNFSMTVAFVLLNCELGFEGEILEQLQQFDIVKEIHGTFGSYDLLAKLESSSSYDLLAKLESSSSEDINMVVTSKIRKLKNVKSSMTLLAMG